jgi:hypothetical protein
MFSAENKHPLNEILPQMSYYFVDVSGQLISLKIPSPFGNAPESFLK